MNKPKIHYFDEQLHKSHTKEGALDRIYHNYFQNVTGVEHIARTNDMNLQRAGIDTFVTLKSGMKIRVQEKWRYRKYTGDVLIEYCSVFKNGECVSPGWIYTIDSDYIFIVYEPSELVKIYPVVQLKMAWNINCEQWMKEHRKINAQNDTYITKSIAVPTRVLEDEILKTMRFNFQRSLSETGC